MRFEKRPGRRLGRIWSADFEDASRKQVNDVLDALAYVLNVIDAHYSGFGTYFKVGYGPGGATSLLYALDDGLRAARKRQERLAGGLFDKDDRPRAL